MDSAELDYLFDLDGFVQIEGALSPAEVARLNAALESRYAIEREIGEGGMVTVYLADDLKHERKVAVTP